MNTHLVSTSKFLSLVLRHRPDKIGLSLDPQGWADVEELLRRSAASGRTLTRAVLEEVVRSNDKQRFVFSEDGCRIRANQGHSVAVDLGSTPTEPPPVLFHGTATRFLASIQSQGLLPGRRQHVHLSADAATAGKVGQRHGNPVVLRIDAARMHAAGYAFFRAENGVWLTGPVPADFLEVVP